KQRGVRVGRAIDGLRTISITDTQRRITDLEKTLDAAITNDEQPRSEALLTPFWDLVEGKGTGGVHHRGQRHGCRLRCTLCFRCRLPTHPDHLRDCLLRWLQRR